MSRVGKGVFATRLHAGMRGGAVGRVAKLEADVQAFGRSATIILQRMARGGASCCRVNLRLCKPFQGVIGNAALLSLY